MAAGAALAVALVAATGRMALGGGASEPPRPQRYVVRAGDTLWEIARGLVGPAGDPRPVVEEIRRDNDLKAADVLLPGRLLLISGG